MLTRSSPLLQPATSASLGGDDAKQNKTIYIFTRYKLHMHAFMQTRTKTHLNAHTGGVQIIPAFPRVSQMSPLAGKKKNISADEAGAPRLRGAPASSRDLFQQRH